VERRHCIALAKALSTCSSSARLRDWREPRPRQLCRPRHFALSERPGCGARESTRSFSFAQRSARDSRQRSPTFANRRTRRQVEPLSACRALEVTKEHCGYFQTLADRTRHYGLEERTLGLRRDARTVPPALDPVAPVDQGRVRRHAVVPQHHGTLFAPAGASREVVAALEVVAAREKLRISPGRGGGRGGKGAH